MDQFDFVTAQLRENREQMSAVDREAIARAIFATTMPPAAV